MEHIHEGRLVKGRRAENTFGRWQILEWVSQPVVSLSAEQTSEFEAFHLFISFEHQMH